MDADAFEGVDDVIMIVCISISYSIISFRTLISINVQTI